MSDSFHLPLVSGQTVQIVHELQLIRHELVEIKKLLADASADHEALRQEIEEAVKAAVRWEMERDGN
jgi:hypothetical protein